MAILPSRIAVVGSGRLGAAVAAALERAGVEVEGPLRRREAPAAEVVLLCVPDAEIAAAAECVDDGRRLIGHTSGATPLRGPVRFGLHPLQTFPGGGDDPDRFPGAGCAIAGTTPEALEVARALAGALGMNAFEIDDSRRAAYHAAASIASNFLVTLEEAAEAVAAEAGLGAREARELLAPLVRATVENWAALGPERALTGPVARGDEGTIAAQRQAVAESRPELLPLWDALVERTRALAGAGVAA